MAVGLMFALGLTGCASTSKPASKAGPKYVFFPPAPDVPRLQFLTAIGSEKDLRGTKGGGLLAYLTGADPSENPLAKPYGAVFAQNKLYVCDTGYRAVMTLDFEKKEMHAVAPGGEGAFKIPLNVAVDDQGTCYVADTGRDRLIMVDKYGQYVGAMGERGGMQPRDVVVTSDRLYVADHQGPVVHVYEKATRKLLFDVPNAQDAQSKETKIFQPNNIAVDSQGRIYVGDTGAFRVEVYGADGKFLRNVGHYGDNIGEFVRIKGIAVDRAFRLYAVDAATQQVQMFDDKGQLLMWFGDPGNPEVGLNLPAKVLVDYDHVDYFRKYAAPNFEIEHLVIVISQLGPRKISIYGFGHPK